MCVCVWARLFSTWTDEFHWSNVTRETVKDQVVYLSLKKKKNYGLTNLNLYTTIQELVILSYWCCQYCAPGHDYETSTVRIEYPPFCSIVDVLAIVGLYWDCYKIYGTTSIWFSFLNSYSLKHFQKRSIKIYTTHADHTDHYDFKCNIYAVF